LFGEPPNRTTFPDGGRKLTAASHRGTYEAGNDAPLDHPTGRAAAERREEAKAAGTAGPAERTVEIRETRMAAPAHRGLHLGGAARRILTERERPRPVERREAIPLLSDGPPLALSGSAKAGGWRQD
jgi:hypothetical protein